MKIHVTKQKSAIETQNLLTTRNKNHKSKIQQSESKQEIQQGTSKE